MVPIVPTYKCTKDTVVNGKLIPKNTLTQPFFWGANIDEKYFKNHSTFNPDRFFDNEGKRACAGKSLAEPELLLFFTTLLQGYKFIHSNGPVDLSYDFADVLLPRPYTCKIEKRVNYFILNI